MVTETSVNRDLKSGILLEICKNPKEFFISLRDDLLLVSEQILAENPRFNENMSFAILEYFDENFNV